MTQVFDADGTVHPATVIKAGPCVVLQSKNMQSDGYDDVQLAFVEETPVKANKPTAGHFKKANVPPTRVRREVKVASGPGEKTEDDSTEVGAPKFCGGGRGSHLLRATLLGLRQLGGSCSHSSAQYPRRMSRR